MNFKILLSFIMFNFYATILPMDDMPDLNHGLMNAIAANDIVKVNELLAQGANPNYDTFYSKDPGYSPLHKATKYGYLNLVKTLLNNGANLESKTHFCNDTVLHLAAEKGHAAIVLELLKKGANVNALDAFRRTPLHVTVEYDHPETLQILLNMGAEVDIKDNHGNTALHAAAILNRSKTLKVLFTQLSNPFIVNYETKKASDLTQNPLTKAMLTEYEINYQRQNLENLKIFLQELQKKRGYKPDDDYQALTTEVSQYL